MPTSAPAPAPAAARPAAPAAGAPSRTVSPAPTAAQWDARLRSAEGNDDALLALLLESAPIGIKLGAVGALTSEAALRQAERELRQHDRRAHRLAKQRLATLLAQRETHLKAGQLTASARALLDEPLIAANRLVDLDRAWQALDRTLIDNTQATAFDALLARLTALTRERADRVLAVERWTASARKALDDLRSATECAAGATTDPAALDAAEAAARTALDAAPATRPDADANVTDREIAALRDTIRHALQASAALAQATAARAVEAQHTPPPPEAPSRRAEHDTSKQHDAHATAALAQSVERVEAALADGHVVEAGRHLAAIDALLHDGARAGALRANIDRLHAEVARLKGWQHWGGRLARDELVAQAEALATAGPDASDVQIARLTTRQRAELIGELRARWKELDRVGGASNRALWERFDAALKAAYEPVAAQAQAQREARTQNLQGRHTLLNELDAVPLPDAGSEAVAIDWKPVAAALAAFHSAWRKLGPLEHTVPRAERDAVQARLETAVARLDGPLGAARSAAQAEREKLIESARALSVAGTAHGRDGLDKLRALQAEWQQAAKALPLARAIENALWNEFKAASDALIGARQAAFDARDAAFKAQGAARGALIARVEALSDESPPDEIRRTLADVEAHWRQAGLAPRAQAGAFEARYRTACDAARARLADAAQRAWRARCGALLARLVAHDGPALPGLPQAADADASADMANPTPADATALPASWERALTRRTSSAKTGDGLPGSFSNDELLLQLEAALGLASPQGFESARRELKLQAMKAALETRASLTSQSPDANALLVEAIARAAFDATQRERLLGTVEAMRDLEPMKAD